MKWKYIKTDGMPLTYRSDDWDGKMSDQLVFEDKLGKRYLGHYYDGFLDGSEFKDWYDSNYCLINTEIVKYLNIED